MAYIVEETLKNLIKWINKCAYFDAAAGKLITEVHIFWIVYGIISDTGQYMRNFCVWIVLQKTTNNGTQF